MNPDDYERLVEYYTSVTDLELEEAHAAGPDGYRDREVWNLIDEEYRRRAAEPRGGADDEAGPQSIAIDPQVVQELMQQMRAEQNLLHGALAGLAAAVIGAVLWAVVTAMSGYQIGFMALGVGFLVGVAVCAGGKGVDMEFGIAGAALSLVGCLAGNLLAVCILVSRQEGIELLQLLSRLTPGIAAQMLNETFAPMDLLFYGIAVYEGYRFSFRRLTRQDLAAAMRAPVRGAPEGAIPGTRHPDP